MPASDLLPLRQPQLLITADGQPLNGASSAEIIATNFLSADRFSAEIALGADPGLDADYWSGTTTIQIEIAISAEGLSAPVSLITGAADTIELDLLRGLVVVEGRDLTAKLIEARTQDTFANRTSSEIATLLAQRAGLTAQVKATTTPVGRYYQDQHARVTLDQFSRTTTDWDLLVYLAKLEAFDVFVQGQTLYFQPPASNVAAPISLDINDIESLRLSRELTLAGPLLVTVKSYNSKQQTTVTATAGTSGGRSFVVVKPNLTSDAANRLAQQKLTELTAHERRVHARMPGELTIFPRAQVQLQGTGTAFDQTYAVDEVTRRLGVSVGFTQTVRMRSASTSAPSAPAATSATSIYS